MNVMSIMFEFHIASPPVLNHVRNLLYLRKLHLGRETINEI